MKLDTEILIIGGGPAGSTAAIAAAQKNIKAIVIDRSSFPRDKICGDGLALFVLDLLEEMGVKKELFFCENKFEFPKYMTFHNSKKESLVLDNPFITVKRMELDNLLWQSVPDAVMKYEQVKIESITRINGKYSTKLNVGKEHMEIRSDFIIGADGYSSYVKRQFFNDLKFSNRIASRYYIENAEYDHGDAFNFYFDDELSPGYFWAFKVGKTSYNTGVYIDGNKDRDIYEIHDHFLQKYFNVSLTKEGFHTWTIPHNMEFSTLAKDNVLLTGDAAGLCDKLFGHGLDTAIISGYAAIKSISYYKSENNNKYDFSEIYRYNLQHYVGRMLQNTSIAYNRIKENNAVTLDTLNSFFKHEIH